MFSFEKPFKINKNWGLGCINMGLKVYGYGGRVYGYGGSFFNAITY